MRPSTPLQLAVPSRRGLLMTRRCTMRGCRHPLQLAVPSRRGLLMKQTCTVHLRFLLASCSPLSPGLAHETLFKEGSIEERIELAVPSRRGLLMKLPDSCSTPIDIVLLAVPSRRGLLMKHRGHRCVIAILVTCSPLSPGLAHETRLGVC